MTSWPDPYWERRDRRARWALFGRRALLALAVLAALVGGAFLIAVTAASAP